MDPKRFYGRDSRNIVPMDIPDDSEDEGLSDDDRINPDIIIPESDLEMNNSDGEDDNISLDQFFYLSSI
ncbi:hypothetical protein QE152_g17101 [Popillia japonica]|uniref:Uncharacterized protein n=1 Tax=Popillia japonica TaxID=7064 RepID=A0AAW1L6F9_POPJA